MERLFLIISNSSSMPQISWRHGMPLAQGVWNYQVRTPNCYDISLANVLRICARLWQPSALPLHFLPPLPWRHLGLPQNLNFTIWWNTVCFHLVAVVPALVHLPSAIWDPNRSPGTQDEWLKRDHSDEQMASVTWPPQLRSAGESTRPHWEHGGVCMAGSA